MGQYDLDRTNVMSSMGQLGVMVDTHTFLFNFYFFNKLTH